MLKNLLVANIHTNSQLKDYFKTNGHNLELKQPTANLLKLCFQIES